MEKDNRTPEQKLEARIDRLENLVQNIFSHVFHASRMQDGKKTTLLKGRVDNIEARLLNIEPVVQEIVKDFNPTRGELVL